MGFCFLCGVESHSIEQHHIKPVAYGGDKDGETIGLCPNCHRDCHRQAEAILAKNPEKKYIMSVETFEKAKPIIAEIIRAKLDKDEKNTTKKIFIELDSSLLVKLHKCKQDAGYKNLQNFIVDVLTSYIMKNL